MWQVPSHGIFSLVFLMVRNLDCLRYKEVFFFFLNLIFGLK